VVAVLLAFTGSAPAATVQTDFNGDGRSDLAVGVPREDLGNGASRIPDAGAVNVIYGSGSGLGAPKNQVWHQNASGIQGAAEPDDLFGFGLAAGDFDGDGYSDLAVGAVGEDLSQPTAGAIHVIYGSASGLQSGGNQLIHQDTVSIKDAVETGDRFGGTLAVGDFDGDQVSDLAVGVPGESAGPFDSGAQFAGAVSVLYGAKPGGLGTNQDDQFFNQDTPGIAGGAEEGDEFGSALAAGFSDFNEDSRADLAVGVPTEDIGSGTSKILNAGSVNVIYGSASGLTAAGNRDFWQDAPGIGGDSEENDKFGRALAAGNFNGSSGADLAVGVPIEDLGSGSSTIVDAGAVNVIYGSGSGLTATGNQVLHQNSNGIVDESEVGDGFGHALAVGDFNGNLHEDLAVGVPSENIGSGTFKVDNAGAVNVIYGSARGLFAGGNQFWHQNGPIADASEPNDNFGKALAAGNFNNAYADLAVGVPPEDIGSGASRIPDAGAANVIYGSGSGLTATGNQFFHQNTSGILGEAEEADFFSDSLASR
jgi:hypothetical protein